MGPRTRVSHRLGGFLTSLLLLSTAYGQSTTSSSDAPQHVREPTVVEFDIVFPREGETYAPADNFPIVLAVRNPMAALTFRPTGSWELWKFNETAETQPRNWNEIIDFRKTEELGLKNSTTHLNIQNGKAFPSNFTTDKNPHYFSFNTSNLNATVEEGKYYLDWTFMYFNCSHPPTEIRYGSWGVGWDISSAIAVVTFSISKDGSGVRIVCDEPVRAPAAGQSAVVYCGDKLIGGGFICA